VAEYARFVTAAQRRFPERFAPARLQTEPLTFNGAGSLTISTYNQINITSPLNDYAIGSGFCKPKDFDFFTLTALVPVLWIAGPVLKYMGNGDCVPFIDEGWKEIEALFPEWFCQGFFISGVGLNALQPECPEVYPNPFYAGDSNVNLLPTQALFHANCSVSVGVGDNIFFRPQESDIVTAFHHIVLLKGHDHAVAGSWSVYRGGIS